MKYRILCFTVLTIFFLLCGTAPAQSVRYAELGDFKLENGSMIKACRMVYLTSGTLNADKSNAVLVPTWLAGTAKELTDIGFIGPGKIFDSSRYYIIALESFGSGGSSSPSNSVAQPGSAFPRFTIRDIVRAQHAVLTEHLKLKHIRAVAGISMGAMATFQWTVLYPDFMDKAIPILGTPFLTSYDLLLWSAQLEILENIRECRGSKAAMQTLAPLHVMHAWTPGFRAAQTRPDAFPAFLAEQQKMLSKYDAADWASQVRAIMSHDILKPFGGEPEKAASAVRAECLVISSSQDQVIYNETAKSFARLIGAEVAELNGTCGHFAFLCDRENLEKMVNFFLDKKPVSPVEEKK